MITYITDQREGEPDILTPVLHEPLIIRTLGGVEILRQKAPQGGWTHDQLTTVQPDNRGEGSEAYLGASWVGSTEV